MGNHAPNNPNAGHRKGKQRLTAAAVTILAFIVPIVGVVYAICLKRNGDTGPETEGKAGMTGTRWITEKVIGVGMEISYPSGWEHIGGMIGHQTCGSRADWPEPSGIIGQGTLRPKSSDAGSAVSLTYTATETDLAMREFAIQIGITGDKIENNTETKLGGFPAISSRFPKKTSGTDKCRVSYVTKIEGIIYTIDLKDDRGNDIPNTDPCAELQPIIDNIKFNPLTQERPSAFDCRLSVEGLDVSKLPDGWKYRVSETCLIYPAPEDSPAFTHPSRLQETIYYRLNDGFGDLVLEFRFVNKNSGKTRETGQMTSSGQYIPVTGTDEKIWIGKETESFGCYDYNGRKQEAIITDDNGEFDLLAEIKSPNPIDSDRLTSFFLLILENLTLPKDR
ncbi:hypothetical protein JW899_03355 [Candidatus Uhrbacteria bacterium]|nr:hypothetical protein [Candidatus Uhrbacteria bacterium]